MNATSNSGGFLGSNNIGGFGYAIGVSVGILFLITTITLASYFCTKTQQPAVPPRLRIAYNTLDPPGLQNFVVDIGLDDNTIESYPKMLYSEAKLQKKDSTSSCCSICLVDYKGNDTLWLLPDCRHAYDTLHVQSAESLHSQRPCQLL
ncbi:hypothetical protein FF1_008712 [Malus domestica]